MPEPLAKKVLLIGWDAADWKVINPLLDSGQMPALQRLVERGVIGNLATLDPPLSPMLWTSIATGKTADKHGVLGFMEPDEEGASVRPVLSTSRRVKALWNILSQQGLKTNVVGWWPSHPAEPVNGVSVSNFYHRARGPVFEPWPLPSGAVHPDALADTLAACRVHPAELTEAHLLPFIPRAGEIDQAADRRLQALAKTLAEASSVHAAATWVMEHTEWDFMAVYYDAIDHFSHAFMKYHPPRMPHIEERDFAIYSGVMAAAYRFHDMMLDRLLDLAGEDTTVLLISDHGFHSDHLRPALLPQEPAGPALEHRSLGVFCLAGPSVLADERIYGANLLDIAPTVLALFGLPVGRDMDGQPLVQAFAPPPEIEYVDSWEAIDGADGMHDRDARRDPWAEQEALAQLAELGYIDPVGGDQRQAVEQAVRESKFYLARAHLSAGRPEAALPLLEAIYAQEPKAYRYAVRLARCYFAVGRIEEARSVVQAVRAQGSETDPALDLLEGHLLLAENRPDEALALLTRAEQHDPHFPALHKRIGEAYLQLGRPADAARAFAKATAIDADSAVAYHGLAIAHLRQEDYEAAVDHALHAIGIRYHFPLAHYHLGEALMRLGRFEQAAQAFEVCVAQRPGIKKAHLWLSELYRVHLDDPKRATEHLRFATEQIQPAVSVEA